MWLFPGIPLDSSAAADDDGEFAENNERTREA